MMFDQVTLTAALFSYLKSFLSKQLRYQGESETSCLLFSLASFQQLVWFKYFCDKFQNICLQVLQNVVNVFTVGLKTKTKRTAEIKFSHISNNFVKKEL